MGLKQPDFEEKAHLQKKLHDPNDRYTFDDNARIFGNDHGISFLQSLQTQINHLNQMLSPNVRHVYSIRTPILYQFANTRKPLPSSIRHHRNQIAHGGQIESDLAILESEDDPYQKRVWITGIQNLYGVSPHVMNSVKLNKKIIDIANARADLITMHHLNVNHQYVTLCDTILQEWCDAVEKSISYDINRNIYRELMIAVRVGG